VDLPAPRSLVLAGQGFAGCRASLRPQSQEICGATLKVIWPCGLWPPAPRRLFWPLVLLLPDVRHGAGACGSAETGGLHRALWSSPTGSQRQQQPSQKLMLGPLTAVDPAEQTPSDLINAVGSEPIQTPSRTTEQNHRPRTLRIGAAADVSPPAP